MARQNGLHILVKVEMLACASAGDTRLRVTAPACRQQQYHCCRCVQQAFATFQLLRQPDLRVTPFNER
jgi:hypothetical protein